MLTSQRRHFSRRLLRRRQTRRAGERARQQPHGQLGSDAADFHRQHAAQRAAEDNQKAQQDVVLRVFSEIAEELRPGDEAHRGDERGQSEIANHAGNFHAKMAEHQRCQQHARRAQLHAANFDSADQIADRRNDKDCQKTAHWLILLC